MAKTFVQRVDGIAVATVKGIPGLLFIGGLILAAVASIVAVVFYAIWRAQPLLFWLSQWPLPPIIAYYAFLTFVGGLVITLIGLAMVIMKL